MTDTITVPARMAHDNPVRMTVAQRKAFHAAWTEWQATLGLKPKADASYTALGDAFTGTDHATNSWQLTGELNIAEGTLYAAITVAHRAGMLERVAVGRSHLYVPVIPEAKAPAKPRKARKGKVAVEVTPAVEDEVA
jgi:hypothetical protein